MVYHDQILDEIQHWEHDEIRMSLPPQLLGRIPIFL